MSVQKISRQQLDQIARNIETVKKHARVVFEIVGDEVREKTNPNFKLDVIAIVGKGLVSLVDNSVVDEASLCEVGLCRTHPYCRCRTVAIVQPRGKFFKLSPKQHQLVGPLVFAKLAELAEEKVSRWENRTFFIPTPKAYYWRTANQFNVSWSHKEQPKGVRFSVDWRDDGFVSDIYWAELYGNKQVANQLAGLARFISMCLALYREDGRSLKRFSRLKRVLPVLDVLSNDNLPRYQKIELLRRYLPGGMKYPHLQNLAEFIGWDLEQTEVEKRIANVYPGVIKRLGNIQLRITRAREQLVFELYPPLPPPAEKQEELFAPDEVSFADITDEDLF